MSSGFIGLIIFTAGVITISQWRKSNGKMSVLRGLLGWVITTGVMIGAIMIANLVVDKWS